MRPRKKILCVEANEQVLSVRKFLLETRGNYRVLEAGSAADALEILSDRSTGTIDLLIADVQLPQMDGNELVRRARRLHPALPTLLISGTVTNYDRAIAADAFLPKGSSGPTELLVQVKQMVARKRGPKKQVQRAEVGERAAQSFAPPSLANPSLANPSLATASLPNPSAAAPAHPAPELALAS